MGFFRNLGKSAGAVANFPHLATQILIGGSILAGGLLIILIVSIGVRTAKATTPINVPTPYGQVSL